MNAHTQGQPNYGFVIGLVTGTFVGAAVAMWFAPRAGSELRQQMTDSARILGQRASEQYRQASTRLGEAVDRPNQQGSSRPGRRGVALAPRAPGTGRPAHTRQ